MASTTPGTVYGNLLAPEQSKEISFTLGDEALSFFDDLKMQWVLEPGDFDVLVGASSRDIRVRGAVKP